MKQQILNKHHIFQSKYAIQEIIDTSLGVDRLNFFAYGRFYKNGKVNLLTTCPTLYQHFLIMNYQFTSPMPRSLISQEFCYLLNYEGNYQQALADCVNLFNLYYPLDIIMVEEDYYEMFCFGFNYAVTDHVNFYMNNLGYLKRFCLLFKKQASFLIKSGENHFIYLPPHLRSNILTDYCMRMNKKECANKILSHTFSPDRHDLFPPVNNLDEKPASLQKFSFSRRESECLKLLCEGYSQKQIARALSISFRTVEYYIHIAKQKTHCKKQTELIAKYIASITTDCPTDEP